MQFDEDSAASAQYLKQAVPLMVQRQIPTNPLNYALWYSHVKNINKELSERLLFEFPAAGTYDPQKSQQLFYDYFVRDQVPAEDETQGAVAELLSQLFDTVNKATEGTSQYSESLKNTIAAVQNTDDPKEVQKALSNLLRDTDAVNQLTQDFQSHLVEARQEVENLRQQLQASEKTALLDELTQIGNRRAFDQTIARCLRDSSQPTTLLLLDLDHFKKCNDTYGHVTGDRILEEVGDLLSGVANDQVHPMRYGGEEFAVICEQPAEAASQIAETIREQVTAISVRQADTGDIINDISVSIGVAQASADDSADSLKERADKALYQAKENGRNRVELAS
ncbi:GGDEF domain-containing protein [bacterium SCSIO 12696]|nr:GGDEF domain-containing protein [bacterium SCSIO 12696]